MVAMTTRRLAGALTIAALMTLAGAAPAQAQRATHYDQVEAHTTDVYSGVFFDTGPCWIEVQGDGDTDLDLYVYDEDNNLILLRQDTGPTDRCRVEFNAAGPGTCRIEIKNLGNVYNRYKLSTSG